MMHINKSNVYIGTNVVRNNTKSVKGQFVDKLGDRFYEIENFENMKTFFVSIVSSGNHWLFTSSNGGVCCGRTSPDYALFPYTSVDKIIDSVESTGPKTILFIEKNGQVYLWEPFSLFMDKIYNTEKKLYKNSTGNKILFEEYNKDLEISFSYMWAPSSRFGFVKSTALRNTGSNDIQVEILDGVRNIIPPGIDAMTQMRYSCLADAYKQNELEPDSGMGIFGMASQITDLPEPKESLTANVGWSTGLENPVYLISDNQVKDFQNGKTVKLEKIKKGIRGAYFVNSEFSLSPYSLKEWKIILDVNRTQKDVSDLLDIILSEKNIHSLIDEDIQLNGENITRISGQADGLQCGNDELSVSHHFTNVLFNCMRGGIFEKNYMINCSDLLSFIKLRNIPVFEKYADEKIYNSEYINKETLLEKASEFNNPDLLRLSMEYLPVYFSRRHGDPSRPWNQFAIHIRDENKRKILNYQGNWRDIFQNWEALCISYPEFIGNIIAKFLNASTLDGYNPYRISREGIDWEIIDPDDPWSSIGYWGDHQVIYLLKFLEWNENFFPSTLQNTLSKEIYCYSNVPYRIKSYREILKDPYNTIHFDSNIEKQLLDSSISMGTDAKLVLKEDRSVYHVNLTEKLMVLFLTKLYNFVPFGGIWMNTQRPEWNDANNALAGYGLSMVTLSYLVRFLNFLRENIFVKSNETVKITEEVLELFYSLERIFEDFSSTFCNPLNNSQITPENRKVVVDNLQNAGNTYRKEVYSKVTENKQSFQLSRISGFIETVLPILEIAIKCNKRADGLYNSYNTISFGQNRIEISNLPEMVEGQVSILSSNFLDLEEVVDLLDSLKISKMYREDQHSYILYPDKELRQFLDKGIIPDEDVRESPFLTELTDSNSDSIVSRDSSSCVRFGSGCVNAGSLKKQLNKLESSRFPKKSLHGEKDNMMELYEKVFGHSSFTGRSSSMYGYEGLGSIYWHMVSKLLLAVGENYIQAIEKDNDAILLKKLSDTYYDIRKGIGFNKSPEAYGAFPTDPYSHTPSHSGAQQPGMTGQVKEEIICRFWELGLIIKNGSIHFLPSLLRTGEFLTVKTDFKYVDIEGSFKTLELEPKQLGFTFCQVPVIYTYLPGGMSKILIEYNDCGKDVFTGNTLKPELSREIFRRSGRINSIRVDIN